MTTNQSKIAALVESAKNYAAAYGLLVRIEFAANEGIDLWTRASNRSRWYHHGLFGTDTGADAARCEIAESMYAKYGK